MSRMPAAALSGAQDFNDKRNCFRHEPRGCCATVVAIAAWPPAPDMVGRNCRITAVGRLRHWAQYPVSSGLRHSRDFGRMVFGPMACVGVGVHHAVGSRRIFGGTMEATG